MHILRPGTGCGNCGEVTVRVKQSSRESSTSHLGTFLLSHIFVLHSGEMKSSTDSHSLFRDWITWIQIEFHQRNKICALIRRDTHKSALIRGKYEFEDGGKHVSKFPNDSRQFMAPCPLSVPCSGAERIQLQLYLHWDIVFNVYLVSFCSASKCCSLVSSSCWYRPPFWSDVCIYRPRSRTHVCPNSVPIQSGDSLTDILLPWFLSWNLNRCTQESEIRRTHVPDPILLLDGNVRSLSRLESSSLCALSQYAAKGSNEMSNFFCRLDTCLKWIISNK